MDQDQSNYLPRVGEALVNAGYITHEQLDKALEVQADTDQRLGPILARLGFVDENTIDRCLMDMVIAPVLAREIDAATDGAYGSLKSPIIEYSQLYRRKLVTDNLLENSAEHNRTVVVQIHGAAAIRSGPSCSLPFAFQIDTSDGMVALDELDVGGLHIWIKKLAKAQSSNTHSSDECLIAGAQSNSADATDTLQELSAAIAELSGGQAS